MAKTLERPRTKQHASTGTSAGAGESVVKKPTPPPANKPETITAFAITKAAIGQNLWQLLTLTIDPGLVDSEGKWVKKPTIVNVDRSVEDLREILVAKLPDLIGGFL